MKLSDHLSKQQRDNLNKIKKKKKEKVNWPEIMGMNRDTYKRVNGAIRRK